MFKLILAVALFATFTNACRINMFVEFSATNLPNSIPIGIGKEPDSKATILKIIDYINFSKVGETSVIQNDNNPIWKEIFRVTIDSDFLTELEVNVWDQDFGIDDLIGIVRFPLTDLLMTGNRIERKIVGKGDGKLQVRAQIIDNTCEG